VVRLAAGPPGPDGGGARAGVSGPAALGRLRVTVRGVVQGVGFRPRVHALAVEHGLAGTVANGPGGVEVDVEGPPGSLSAFLTRLEADPPPAARVEAVEVDRGAPPLGRRGFAIVPSSAAGGAERVLVPPDLGPCPACLEEALAPAGRRAGYPFTSCTACGPRLSILRGLPYERSRTAMAEFALCGACAAEYADPADRRFHAETQACPACGPGLALADPAGAVTARGGAALAEARGLVARGGILALEGVGGWQLACDAADPAAVARLRERKRRPAKPLALLVADVAAARRIAAVEPAAAAALEGPARPIVLLPRRPGAPLAPGVAPGLTEVGVMLPASPLHRLLLAPEAPPVWVLTSGNVHGRPLVASDAGARDELGPVADALLGHDREVVVPQDDSVVRVVLGRPCRLRRARGDAPEVVALPRPGPDLLAWGGDLKAAACLVQGGRALVTPHLGDLDVPEVEARARAVVARLSAQTGHRPEAVACDLHPDYVATRLAREAGLPVVAVQHHHAHAAAVLAEHGEAGPALACVLDGAGFGPDGTVWGGELLRVDLERAERLGALRTVRLPGVDAAAREPWRAAVAHAAAAGLEPGALPPLPEAPGAEVTVGVWRLARDGGPRVAPRTSSAGRLFDAVAALAGLRGRSSYEGQAACELEAAAGGVAADPYPLPLVEADGLLRLDPRPLVRAVVADVGGGAGPERVARRFHAALAAGLAAAVARLRAATGLEQVVLAGGCFQNRLLRESLAARLEAAGAAVLHPVRFPAGDGGLSLGQAAVASARLAGGCGSRGGSAGGGR